MRSARSTSPVASATRRGRALLLVAIVFMPVPQLETGLSLGEQRHELSDPGAVEPGHGAIDGSLDLSPVVPVCRARRERIESVSSFHPPTDPRAGSDVVNSSWCS
jgi:hypothetical protein